MDSETTERRPMTVADVERAIDAEHERWREAMLWRRTHLSGFMRALSDCTDVQTLRALAHRLGYKEGT